MPLLNLNRALEGILAAKGWSQNRLAKESEIPQPSVYRILTGQQHPTPEMAAKLLRPLGLTMEQTQRVIEPWRSRDVGRANAWAVVFPGGEYE